MREQGLVREQKKKRKRLKIIGLLFAFVLLLCISFGIYLFIKTSNALKNANQLLEGREKSSLREIQVEPLTSNVSVLIIGVDENEKRNETNGGVIQSDALLLATFNKNDMTVKLVSIPRDTYTLLPINGRIDRINHAYSVGTVRNGENGGPAASMDAVESLLNVPVDYYVKFNFQSFIQIVDELGGIEVDVPIDFSEQDSNDKKGAISLTKGMQTLTGEEALALARTRKIDSDIMRGQRQQLVIEAIIKKAASVGTITKVDNLVDAIDGQFTTNLTMQNILSFYKYGIGAQIEKLQIEGEDFYNGGLYYYKPNEQNLTEITNTLRTHLGL